MANTAYAGSSLDTVSITINSSSDYFLPPGLSGKNNPVCRWIIQLVPTGWTGTITVKSRLMDGNSAAQVPVPYIGLYVNGAVGTGALVSTALTTTSLIEVDASEQEIVLSTAFTGGSMLATARLVQG